MGHQTGIPPDKRKFGVFLVALWRRPGFKLTLTSVALLVSPVLRNGSLNLVITLAILYRLA